MIFLRFIFVLLFFLSPLYSYTWESLVTYVEEASLFEKALLDGDLKTVKKFIEEKKENLYLRDRYDRTPLHLAAMRNHSPLVTDKYFHSKPKDQIKVLDYLISKGAGIHVHVKDIHGDSPLHLAVRLGNFKPAKFLIKQGADIHAKNILGHSPYSMTRELSYRSQEIKNLLSDSHFLIKNPDHQKISKKENLLQRLRSSFRRVMK